MDIPNQVSNIEDILELSPMQQGMLFQSHLAPTSGVFFEQQIIALAADLDVAAFEAAWQAIVDRTPVLRTSFHWHDMEKPVQVVHRRVPIALEYLDWSTTPYSNRQRDLEDYLKDIRRAGFDLETPPLMRLSLLRLSSTELWFVWHFHHILLDGWSGQLVLNELLEQYRALIAGQTYTGPPRRPFGDYIGWLQQRDLARAEAYWKKTLHNFSAPTAIGVGKPGIGTPQQGNEGQFLLRLSERYSAALRQFARANRLTLNTIVQGAWAILLSRYSQNTDVLFGIVVSGRPAELPGIEEMIGLFINTLPLRVNVTPDARVLPWLSEIQADQLQASEFQYVSPLQLQQWSELPARVKPYDSVLVFENFPVVAADSSRTAHQEPFYLGRTDVDLTVIVVPEDTPRLKFLFSERCFDLPTIIRMAGHLEYILQQIPAAAEEPVGTLEILSPAERRQILVEWNDTAEPGFDEKPLMQLLAERTAATPDAVVFIENGVALNLQELDERSNRLAHYLVDCGISPGAVVGVYLERSVMAVVAVVAILKARAAYLPLEPAYPGPRLTHMIANSGAQLVITHAGMPPLAIEVEIVDLTAVEPTLPATTSTRALTYAEPNDAAYVLYTSGSTGVPKGVIVEHRTILNRLHWMWRTYPFRAGETRVMRTALSFVDSLWEILGGMPHGVPTVIAPGEIARDPAAFTALLAENNVSRMWLVPSYLEMLLEEVKDFGARVPALRMVFSGGEPLTADLYQRFGRAAPDATLFNIYGASELWDVTIFDPSHADLSDHRLPGDTMPIGRPIDNTEVYVLDQRLEPVPIGVVGQLFVGGAGLARGYVNRPDLTAERFAPHPFSALPGAKLYDTGDLARQLPDGSLVLAGRRDHQINLRGFRIEPDEIQTILDQHPSVRESAVLTHEFGPGDSRLVAYVVPSDEMPDTPQLLTYLAKRLPSYMVPALVRWIDAMPKTPSGKRDLSRLPELELVLLERDSAAAPRTDVERRLADHFCTLLGLSSVGIHDDFFADLGGHSLLATRLVSRLREDFNAAIPLRTIFDAPTVAQLAIEIGRQVGDDGDLPVSADLLADLSELSPEEIDALLAQVEDEEPGDRS